MLLKQYNAIVLPSMMNINIFCRFNEFFEVRQIYDKTDVGLELHYHGRRL